MWWLGFWTSAVVVFQPGLPVPIRLLAGGFALVCFLRTMKWLVSRD